MKRNHIAVAALTTGALVLTAGHAWAITGGIDLNTGMQSLYTNGTRVAGGTIATIGLMKGAGAAADHRSLGPALFGTLAGGLLAFGAPTFLGWFGIAG